MKKSTKRTIKIASLIADDADIPKLKEKALKLKHVHLSDRQLYDLEMLLSGGFSPLKGFLNEDEYKSVVETMRLPSGEVWPMPIVFDVSKEDNYSVGDEVALCDPYGTPLAVLTVESVYTPDKIKEVESIYGTNDETHPGVSYILNETNDTYVGGKLEGIELPTHHDHHDIRKTPQEVRDMLDEKGWETVVGFQTRNPIHRAHFEMIRGLYEDQNIPVLIHPVVGVTKEGDFDYRTRVRTYKVIDEKYGKDFTHLSLLPLAMRMAGPREAVWHAIIRRNYGCTHFIVGRDHAGPGKDKNGEPFYDADAAWNLAESLQNDLGVKIVSFSEIAYVPSLKKYAEVSKLKEGEEVLRISGTDFRNALRSGKDVPEWFSFPECLDEFKRELKRESNKGFTIFLTGLSGAGKSTIANMLHDRLLHIQDRKISLLDGDIIRQNLSKGLGFSREDRDINVERVGYVASEIVKHQGIAICSMIAPFESARDNVRKMVEKEGTHVEIHVSTSLDVCEERDVKGLYKKARKGLITQFTGIDDPYEEPQKPEIIIDAGMLSVRESVDKIVSYLEEQSLV